jgi:cytochrome c556
MFVAVAVVVALIGAMAVSPSAQTKKVSDEDYFKLMKQVQTLWGSFNKNTKGMQHAAAAKDAEALVPIFKDVQTYWEAKKIEDAVASAKTAVAGLEVLAKETADMEKIGASQKQVQGTCAGCHMAHRDKNPDGTYTIVDKK